MIYQNFKTNYKSLSKDCTYFRPYDFMKILIMRKDGFWFIYDGLFEKVIFNDDYIDFLNQREKAVLRKIKPGQSRKDERNKQILDMRNNGYALSKIAKEFHISKTRVAQILKLYI